MIIPAIYLVLPLGPRCICRRVSPPPPRKIWPLSSCLQTSLPPSQAPQERGQGVLGKPRVSHGLSEYPFLPRPTGGPPSPLPPATPMPQALTGNAGSKLVGELGEKIIVGPVLGGPKDDDGASVVHYREQAPAADPVLPQGARHWGMGSAPHRMQGKGEDGGPAGAGVGQAHLPSVSPSHSSAQSLLDLAGGRVSARGWETRVPEPISPCWPCPWQLSTPRSPPSTTTLVFPVNPTYPVIQSWSPSPGKRRQACVEGWLRVGVPYAPPSSQAHLSSTYLGL